MRGEERPESVVTVTATAGGAPGDGAGAVATHVCWLGQRTAACTVPKSTVTMPLGLKKPLPVKVTCVPGGPADGAIEATAGGPPGAGGAGGAAAGGAGAGWLLDGGAGGVADGAVWVFDGAGWVPDGGGWVPGGPGWVRADAGSEVGEAGAGRPVLGGVLVVAVWTELVPPLSRPTTRAIVAAAQIAASHSMALRTRPSGQSERSGSQPERGCRRVSCNRSAAKGLAPGGWSGAGPAAVPPPATPASEPA